MKLSLREAIEVFRTLPPTVETNREARETLVRIRDAVTVIGDRVKTYDTEDWQAFIDNLTAEDIRFLVLVMYRYASNAIIQSAVEALR